MDGGQEILQLIGELTLYSVVVVITMSIIGTYHTDTEIRQFGTSGTVVIEDDTLVILERAAIVAQATATVEFLDEYLTGA